MIKRPYVNKRGRSILSEGLKKIIKKQKRRRFRCASSSISKSSTKHFWLGKKKRRKYGKRKQNNYGKTRRSKKSYFTKW